MNNAIRINGVKQNTSLSANDAGTGEFSQAFQLHSLQIKIVRMTSEGPLFHKPKSFLSARQTIYASIFTGVLAIAIRTLSVGIANTGGTSFITVTIVFYIIIILLVKQMSLCRKWARTATFLLYVLGMIAYPIVMSQEIKASMLVEAMLVIQAALIIYSLVLLYKKECTEWFNSTPATTELS